MEVLYQEKRSFVLERSIPNEEIVLQDQTTSLGFTRNAYLSPILVTKEILDRLISAGVTPKVKVGQSIPGFVVCVGFQGTAAGPRRLVSTIQLTGESQLLQSLFGGDSHCLEKAMVLLKVSRFYFQPNVGGGGGYFLTPVEKSLLFSLGQGEAKRVEVHTEMNTGDLATNWSSGAWRIDASVKLVALRTTGDDRGRAFPDPLSANRRMLTDDIFADTKVIAQNGAEVKFHRSLLAAHSPAFERMFHTKMQEATSGVLELPDMSEDGVRALKEYLYVLELKAPQENSLVCFELFEAGHKYGICTLEEATCKIFMRMGGAWYSAAVALRLFLLVKDMELPRLKQKAVEFLKSKREEVMTLEQFHDLFKKENVAVARELTECLLASP